MTNNKLILRKLPGFHRSPARLVLAVFLGFCLAFGAGFLNQTGGGIKPVIAQSLRPEFVADTIYQRLPYLPKENQYSRKETGKLDPDNTLISRLVRYHQDVKKRPVIFRLDWQLTLADYLGVNEEISDERYPGYSTLTVNPLAADIKAMSNLTRRQRSELVDVLVLIYNPQRANNSNPEPTPTPAPTPTPTPNSNKPPLSKPGDSQLLLP